MANPATSDLRSDYGLRFRLTQRDAAELVAGGLGGLRVAGCGLRGSGVAGERPEG